MLWPRISRLRARLDYTPMLNLKFGGSVYTGKTTHDSQYFECVDGSCGKVNLPGARLTIWDLHALYSWQGLDLRALFAMSLLKDSDELNRIGGGGKIAKEMYGFYTEAAYDVDGLGVGEHRTAVVALVCASPILTSTPRWPATGTPRAATSTASGPPA